MGGDEVSTVPDPRVLLGHRGFTCHGFLGVVLTFPMTRHRDRVEPLFLAQIAHDLLAIAVCHPHALSAGRIGGMALVPGFMNAFLIASLLSGMFFVKSTFSQVRGWLGAGRTGR